jgi:hypothetical protein
MSNLSELLPAGAGAKSADFVASGTLGSGVTVALKANGTVEAVAETSFAQSVGTKNVLSASTAGNPAAVYDEVNNKIVFVYADAANSSYATAVVGTVSGSTISFGTSVVFNSGWGYIYGLGSDVAGKVLVTFRDPTNSNYCTGIVGSISGTAISFGAKVVFQSSTMAIGYIAPYPPTNKLVVFYQYVGSSNLSAKVATLSGTSVSFGAEETVATSGNSGLCAAYDSVTSKIIVAYTTLSSIGGAKVCTVSGTSTSYGSEAVFDTTTSIGYIGCAYHSGIQKTAVAYTDGSGGNGAVILGTVSGTSISFGSSTVFNAGDTYGTSVNYNPVADRLVFLFRDNANMFYLKVMSATVSGNTFSFTAELQATNVQYGTPAGVLYDPDTDQSILAYSASQGTLQVYTAPYTVTNNTSFIGITDAAIADTTTGAVIVQGGVSDKVTGLTANTDYYVQANGTISATVSTVPAGRALSSTSILLEG